MKTANLAPCACKSLAESVLSGDEIRARMDAVRVIGAALYPFDVEARGRILRAVRELVEVELYEPEPDATYLEEDDET